MDQAGIAQLVEHRLPKPRVAGPNPVARSNFFRAILYDGFITFKRWKLLTSLYSPLNLRGDEGGLRLRGPFRLAPATPALARRVRGLRQVLKTIDLTVRRYGHRYRCCKT